MDKNIQMTKEGYESLEIQLKELVEVKRPQLIERLANARSQGDLAENSDYQNAKEELEFLEGRIDELKEVLEKAKIIDGCGKSSKSGYVAVGTKVKVKVNGDTYTYEIVGEWEADPAEKRISHTSPLGQALVGKSVGEKVEVEAPAGKILYEIISIE